MLKFGYINFSTDFDVEKIAKIISAKKLGTHTYIECLASPLLTHLNQVKRIPLNFNGVESGTTIPLVLYKALKVRYMSELGVIKQENSQIDVELCEIIRRHLSDILLMVREEQARGKEYNVSHSLQELIFRHIVWDEYFQVTKATLVEKNKKNRAHTVTHPLAPSVTIHSYLCRWILEKDDLNPDTDFKHVNPFVREVIDSVLELTRGQRQSKLRTGGTFSRRIQNALMMKAFESTMTSDELEIAFFNPVIER